MLHQPHVKHYSVTHEGTGFKAASVRAVVAGIHAVVGHQYAHSVHKTVGAAAEWHAHQQALLGRTESAATIAGVLTRLRERHRQEFGRSTLG